MKRKRLLITNEASYLNTGYAVYFKNVIPYLRKKYDVAELSVYAREDDKRLNTIPWKTYPNIPMDEEKMKMYNSHPQHQFGSFRFERVCLDFKPDVVLDIRDHWMCQFIQSSIYRNIYSWIWMPTIDGAPQNDEWIYTMSKADKLLTYTKWAKEVVESQSSLKVNGVATPCADTVFSPCEDRDALREKHRLPADAFIVGTVMRNQRRKLFPELFEAFAKFAEGKENVYLYCHTSYPDAGWDLPALMEQYNIMGKVLFTYVCEACKDFSICKFNDSLKQCKECSNFASKPANVASGLTSEELADVYRLMDVYVQPANSEGLGMPCMEAIACGIPAMVTSYSGTLDYITELDAIPILPKQLIKELETGCMRATLDKDWFVNQLNVLYDKGREARFKLGEHMRRKLREKYNWKDVAQVWIDKIEELPYANWNAPPKLCQFQDPPQLQRNSDFVTWLFSNYLPGDRVHEFEWACLLRDLNFGAFKNNPGGFFYSESSVFSNEKYQPFDRARAVEMVKRRGEQNNFWEQARIGQVRLQDEKWLH
jgi:glycosyltransferase involved in cell wall biosynthesis